ncbi:hypothetical protein R6Q59_028458 [Mikania micrantha]
MMRFLNDNHLSGEIPDFFEGLTALVNLDLSSNNNEKLNGIIKKILKEKEEEKERLNGIIAELEAEKEKHKAEKDAMSNRMSKSENMLKTLIRK